MPPWLYVVACIAVPCGVGTVMYAAFDLWDQRRRRSKAESGLPVIDYLI